MEDALYTGGGYLERNPDWHAADSPFKARQVLRMLERNGLRPATVAEVGSGAGAILRELHDALGPDVRYVGYEVSPQAHELAKPREAERLRFELADLTTLDVHFDLLLVLDVIEHLEDHHAFLRAIRAKADRTIFHVPLDLSVQTVLRAGLLPLKREEVGHLHYFSRETALATLRECGYEVLDEFFTAGSLELRPGSRKAWVARVPRRLLAAASEAWAARLLGGFSLLALARPVGASGTSRTPSA
jgi:hypothetical protein